MISSIRRPAATMILVTAALAATACASSVSGAETPDASEATCTPASFDTIVPGHLTVAAIQNLPGFDQDPVSGELTGLDPVLLGDFAEENCLEIDYQVLAGPAAVAAMTEGKADVAAGGWTRTEERGKVLGQTEPATYIVPMAVIAKDEITSVDDLKSLRLGVVGGSVTEAALTEFMGPDKLTTYQSNDAIFEDLQAGRIDGTIGGAHTMTVAFNDRDLADSYTISFLEPESEQPVLTAMSDIDYPYTKANTALGEALGEYVKSAQANGTVAKELEKFGLVFDDSTLELTNSEQ